MKEKAPNKKEIRLSPQARALLGFLGIFLIFIGLFLVLIGAFASSGEVKAGGLILIGPIPFFFASNGSLPLLLLFLLLPIFLFLLIVLLVMRTAFSSRE